MVCLNGKPEIAYPCDWEYRLIGRDLDAIRAAVSEILGEKAHKLEHSAQSSKGKFVSMKLSVVVDHENERLGFFDALRKHTAILHIL